MQNYASLDALRLASRLAHNSIGHTLYYTESTPSTMILARERAHSAPHGLVIVAEEQTAGRGRQGRVWSAPPGCSLLVSVLFKHAALAQIAAQLPKICGLAALEAIETIVDGGESAPRFGLKWPNDLVVGKPSSDSPGARSTPINPHSLGKIGGIIIESALSAPEPAPAASGKSGPPSPHTPFAIAGIGINVNQAPNELPPLLPPALPATSLRLAIGNQTRPNIDRTELLIHLCHALEKWLDISQRTPQTTHRTWAARLVLMDQPILVLPRDGSPPYPAIAKAVSAAGDLLVEDQLGRAHTLTGDEVSIRPPMSAASSLPEEDTPESAL